MLNKTDLAAPLGVSEPTISSWLNVLEMTGQVILVPPLFESFGKRPVKSPKLYCFRDQQGLEVDFVVPRGAGQLLLVEAKAT